MSNAPVNSGRRRFLTVATGVVGGVGVAGAAVPFIASWMPSKKAKAAGAPVEVNIGKMEPGQLIRVLWRGQAIFVVRRTEQMIADLEKVEPELRDPASEVEQQPAYAQNRHRSIKPEYFVAVGLCTHLGCSPTHMKGGAFEELVEGISDGFYCPCHGSKFDIAGRVFAGVPAPSNLAVPPHTYIDDSTIIVGVEEGAA